MKAQELAEIYRPTILQGIKNEYDFISSLYKDPKEHFESRPDIYFFVKEGNGRYYVGYCIYHAKDTASFHDHDFEGVLIKTKGNEVATIFHLDFLFDNKTPSTFVNVKIEPEGHGIKICCYPEMPHSNFMTYKDFCLINMDDPKLFNWDNARLNFGEWVKLPDKYIDPTLEAYVQKEHPVIMGERIETVRGLWYHRPDLLFELAKSAGRL